MRRRVPSADHGKFKGDERQGCEQGGIRSIRFKYHAWILPFWIRGSGKISLWYAMRVNRDKEKLLVTCVCSNIEREAAVRTETIGWIIGILIAAALVWWIYRKIKRKMRQRARLGSAGENAASEREYLFYVQKAEEEKARRVIESAGR